MMQEASEGEAFARSLSILFGWSYFILWSVSFYPQIFVNIRRRSTSGFSPDFPVANLVGLSCYTIYAALLLFSPLIRSQYTARHNGHVPTTQVNDFVYGAHALLCEIVVASQFLPKLWGWSDKVQRPSWTMLSINGACLAYVIGVVCVTALNPHASAVGGITGRTWLDATYSFGNVKLLLTVIKYTPQAFLNYKRKSTVGFAISAVNMDIAGSVLSLLQLFIDSGLQRDWSGITGNPAKFALGNVSLIFDIIYMSQHYILYRQARGNEDRPDGDAEEEEEERPLLRDE